MDRPLRKEIELRHETFAEVNDLSGPRGRLVEFGAGDRLAGLAGVFEDIPSSPHMIESTERSTFPGLPELGRDSLPEGDVATGRSAADAFLAAS
ncbi:hypothetical protein [Streptosporangium sp. NPDC000509]|uniref:hypothetical protein n=1 Tax=Streptosporangium sp. NPDC000509 TaxID=3366186 RepID=UPI00368853B4